MERFLSRVTRGMDAQVWATINRANHCQPPVRGEPKKEGSCSPLSTGGAWLAGLEVGNGVWSSDFRLVERIKTLLCLLSGLGDCCFFPRSLSTS